MNILYELEQYYRMRLQLLLKMEQYRMAALGLSEGSDHPATRLSIRKRDNGYDFYRRSPDSDEEYLCRDSGELPKLAQEEICRKLRKDITAHKDALNRLLTKMVRKQPRVDSRDSYRNYPIGRLSAALPEIESKVLQDMLRRIPPKRIAWLRDPIAWSQTYSCKNDKYPEDLQYETKSGFWVRSKSERRIADRLYDYGIPFCFEMEFRNGSMVRHPDFVLLRPDGTLVVWEHRGKSDDDYMKSEPELIRFYLTLGYRFHENLIFTREEDLRNIATLDRIILRFYYIT